MIWQTPNRAFTALNPPLWLQQDMTLATQIIEGETRSLIIPVDALSNADKLTKRTSKAILSERTSQLEKIVDRIWDRSAIRKGQRLIAAAVSDFGCCADNAIINEYQTLNPIACFPVIISEVIKSPSYSVIVVPPFNMSATALTSSICALPKKLCHPLPDVNIARFTYWHETGHLFQHQRTGARFSDQTNEELADAMALTFLRKKDPATARYIEDFRLLDSFLVKPKPKVTIYWNNCRNNHALSPDMDELGALIELKTRAAEFVLPKGLDRNALVHAAFNNDGDPAFSRAFNRFNDLSSMQKINALARLHHKAPYMLEGSQPLAEAVLGAAQRLVPSILTP